MKNLLVSLVAMTSMFSATAMADGDFGLEVGIRQQSGDIDATANSISSGMGYQFGGTGAFQLSGSWYFRTGLLYTQRNTKLESSITATTSKISMNYADVPLTIMYKFEDYAGVFGGVIAALNLDSKIEGAGKVAGVKTPYIPFVIGATFKFAPQLGGTLYLETGGSVSDDLNSYRAVGANLVITF
jgi:hypothetical protein